MIQDRQWESRRECIACKFVASLLRRASRSVRDSACSTPATRESQLLKHTSILDTSKYSNPHVVCHTVRKFRQYKETLRRERLPFRRPNACHAAGKSRLSSCPSARLPSKPCSTAARPVSPHPRVATSTFVAFSPLRSAFLSFKWPCPLPLPVSRCMHGNSNNNIILNTRRLGGAEMCSLIIGAKDVGQITSAAIARGIDSSLINSLSFNPGEPAMHAVSSPLFFG